jgi:hypothetical protein
VLKPLQTKWSMSKKVYKGFGFNICKGVHAFILCWKSLIVSFYNSPMWYIQISFKQVDCSIAYPKYVG